MTAKDYPILRHDNYRIKWEIVMNIPPQVSVVTMWFSQEVLLLSQPSSEIKLRYLRS